MADEILVACPRCAGCAVTRQFGDERPGWFAPRHLACTKCGHSDQWSERSIARRWREVRDDYFGLPLWLQVPCCGDVLWAYNERHLALIEDYVRAGLRERRRNSEHGWANQALLSRLPRWVKAARSRADVLGCTAKLRKRLPSTGAGQNCER